MTHLVVQADQEMAQVEAELATMVAAESWTRRHAPEAIAAWVDPTADPAWQHAPNSAPISQAARPEAPALAPEAQVRWVEVHGEWALVEVEVAEPEEAWLPSPYRQTRIYRETPTGWRRTAPPAFLWQPVTTHRAGRFTFVYGLRGAAAVMGAAAQIVEMDRRLRRDLALPETEQPLTVHVTPALPPTLDPAMLSYIARAGEIQVPSPGLLALPLPMSEAAALHQLVSEVLVHQAVSEATGGDEISCRWMPLRKGLTLWLQAEYSQLPSSIRFHLVALRQGQWVIPKLWATYTLRVNACDEDGETSYVVTDDTLTATMAVLVEYALSTHGHERMSALTAGMQKYASWQELAPALFGVPVDEFEVDWHQFLAAQYGLEVALVDREAVQDSAIPAPFRSRKPTSGVAD